MRTAKVETLLLRIADSAYPLRWWLPTLYSGTPTEKQSVFNKAYSRPCNLVEHDFSQLKARWCCLKTDCLCRKITLSLSSQHALCCTMCVGFEVMNWYSS